MLSGKIEGFTGGDHVNTGWVVTLSSDDFSSGTIASGTAKGSGPGGAGADGAWSANAYGGSATARPTGIYGGFNAHFVDGHAAGVYATRKQ